MFCRIVRGEATAAVVYRDDAVVAFLDILPAAPGHTLVVPRVHVEEVYELDEETAAGVMRGVVRVARAIRRALAPPGLSVLQRNGRVAGQAVPHLHVHLIPRRPGDGVGLVLHQQRAPQAELEEVAARLRQALEPLA